MPLIPLDTHTALYVVGVVYLLMSGLVWTIVRRHHDGTATSLWCGGGVLIGSTYLLYALRDSAPRFWTVLLPVALGLLGLGLRICALLRERRKWQWWREAMALTALAIVLSLAADLGGIALRRPLVGGLMSLAAFSLAVLAHQVGRLPTGRGAELISGAYAFLGATYVLRLLGTLLGLLPPPSLRPTLDLVLVIAGGLVAGIFGSVGYVGLALEGTRLRREAQARALVQEQIQREAAEAQAAALGERLAERDEFVRVLAHEVRQPLNNASAALQGVEAALQAESKQDRAEAQARLQRARKVIGHIVGALDNTLASTTMLASVQPLSPRDADVNMLVELVMGDLDPTQRGRVTRSPATHARTAAMDIGLMRLALRNLLANALAYSPAGSPVALSISDSDEPLGLVFEVRDEGPGLSTELQQRLFERGARGDHGLPGHGLGLHVVREVMRRHGGHAGWAPNPPGGSVFRLWLPLMEEA
ncbi:sensor histidine kinase [Ideonella sp. YS5]|uniref:sensor histidine kinase n=1 Tax=Ideonella sp. YS5 TaxID=3453714 RepID=UPI003EED356E